MSSISQMKKKAELLAFELRDIENLNVIVASFEEGKSQPLDTVLDAMQRKCVLNVFGDASTETYGINPLEDHALMLLAKELTRYNLIGALRGSLRNPVERAEQVGKRLSDLHKQIAEEEARGKGASSEEF